MYLEITRAKTRKPPRQLLGGANPHRGSDDVTLERIAALFRSLADTLVGKTSDSLPQALEAMEQMNAQAAAATLEVQAAIAASDPERNAKVAALWMPRNEEETEAMQASFSVEPHLPQTPEEWKALEALAPKGPGAVYRWIYGEINY